MSVQAQLRVFAGSDSGDGVPVVLGVPFPAGQLAQAEAAVLLDPEGGGCPAGKRVLARWPDGSVRWCLFSLASKKGGMYRVQTEGVAPPIRPLAHPVRVVRQGQHITISNGLVEVVLGAGGPGPVQKLTALGHDFLAGPQALVLRVDDAQSLHETTRTLAISEDSPVRGRVRVEGAHFTPGGKRKLHYRLDVELWAGVPAARIEYQFLNLEPGQDDLPIGRIAMDLDLNLGEQTKRHFLQRVHTVLYVPREVFNPAPVAIVVDQSRGNCHVEAPSMLLDDEPYNFHVRPPLVDVAPWLGVGDGQRSVYAQMQDFEAMRPKRLSSKSRDLSLEVWPSRAGTLNLPQGRTRRQVLVLGFAGQDHLPAAQAQALLTQPLWEGRACLDPAWVERCGEFDQDHIFPLAGQARMEKFLRRAVHVATPQSMFDLGDTPDSGYLRTYIPIGNAQERKPGAPEIERVFLAGAHSALANWSFPEFYEPVWTNNEYDLIRVLGYEVLRTGKQDHWQTFRWTARHSAEVDFIHYSDHQQAHRATPQHSARHNRSGAILSHFWTQGLLCYYCLTGDEDIFEVAKALGDKIIDDLTDPALRNGFWGFSRELGWPTISLSYLADLTGEERYHKQLKEIVDFFVGYDRKQFTGALHLSSGDARYGLERQMIYGFFAYASMIEGVDHYVRRTDDPKAKAWLVEILQDLREALMQCHRDGDPLSVLGMHPLGMAIGFERTGDPRFLQAGMCCLQEFIDSGGWHTLAPECKTIAMVHRGVVRFLFHAHQQGLLKDLEFPALR